VQVNGIVATDPFSNIGTDPMCWESEFKRIPHTSQLFGASPNLDRQNSLASMPTSKSSHSRGSSHAGPVAVALNPYLIYPGRLENHRESTQSSSSYNSTNTGRSISSKHSSTTSVESRPSRLARPSLSQTMSSGSTKSHPRSNSNIMSSAGLSNIPCTEPECTATFTRNSDRERHIEAQHDNVKYKCLLHTCTSQCVFDCQDPQHGHAVPRSRRDKVRKHLEREHGWNIASKDVPESWLWSYIRQRTGWSCSSCGVFLGNWTENSDIISHHTKVCTEGLPNLIKRLSMEEPNEHAFGSSNSRNGNRNTGRPKAADAHADEEEAEEDSRNSLFG
jgi:hypothetical protein